MSKTLLQAILAAFCAILAHISCMGGGGMNIGARIGCWSGGWKNPYVTTGLVSMLDAEWNVEGGKHDVNILLINDLAWKGKFVDLNGNQLNNKSVTFDGTKSAVGSYTRTSLSEYTIESVIKFNNSPSSSYGSSMLVNSPFITSGIVIGLCITWNVYLVSLLSASNYYKCTSISGLDTQYPHSLTSSKANGENNPTEYRKDNISLALGGYCPSTGVSNDCMTLGGGKSTNYFKGEIYAVRIYNRVLTELEKSSNYAIDKARFGVP